MIDWNAIDTVLLDLDGTLLDLHFDNYFWFVHLPQSYATAHGVALDEARKSLYTQVERLRGTLNWYCLDYWSDLLSLDIVALKREIDDKICLRPHVSNFLSALKARDKRLILATNAHRSGLAVKFSKTAIDQQMDAIFSSHDFQAPKEEPLFWEALQKATGFNPESTAFIDDTPRILQQAQYFGVRHLIHIQQPDMQASPNPASDFLSIHHFDEIMPETSIR